MVGFPQKRSLGPRALCVAALFGVCCQPLAVSRSEQPRERDGTLRTVKASNYNFDARSLFLSELEQNAVVAVVVTGSRSEHICSGVVIAASRVLTALHCVLEPLVPIEIRVGRDLAAPDARVDAFVLSREVRLDLALLRIRGHLGHNVAPIAWTNPTPSNQGFYAADVFPERAGFGIHGVDEGVPEYRRFTFAPVASIQSDSLVVGENGCEGACRGDSGGPLLGRSASGATILLGILTAGSASCTGIDLFTRVDVACAWLRENICEADASTNDNNCKGVAVCQ